MRHGSLFSGIGGFDLAADWMGWENVFHCEWNPFGQKVLKYYWPQAESFTDITKTDFTKYHGAIDIISGGFPCQPYSSAGKRLGKADERHLWPEMLRAIREIEPTYIVGENVRGLLNWNGGMVFDEVCAELENIGYQVAPCLIPACSVGAPHRRERIWFIGVRNATDNNGIIRREGGKSKPRKQSRHRESNESCNTKIDGIVANTNSNGLQRGLSSNLNKQISSKKKHDEKCLSIFRKTISFQNFPTQSPICDGNDGISNRLDGIAFSKWRTESIKAAGNAIVPQVAYEIFKAIQKTEKHEKETNQATR